MKIRRAKPADALKVKNIAVASIRDLCSGVYSEKQIQTWLSGQTVSRFRNMINREKAMFVACVGNRILGYSSLVGREIRAVFVHPKFGGKGVGGKLLAKAEASARRSGATKVHLSSSLNAVRFYKFHDYSIVRKIKHHGSGGVVLSAVKMQKRLTSA